jgi:nucleotide-binding universal stress UspA family protein
LILGQTDVFRQVCSLIGCDEPHFPRIYGNSLVLGMPAGSGAKGGDALLEESLHLMRNTKLLQMTAICQDSVGAQLAQQIDAPQQVHLNVIETGSKLVPAIHKHCQETNVGLVVLPLLEKAVFDVLAKPVHIALAHSLPCPLMVAKNTHSYERILIPFNGSPIAVIALEAALDLAAQIDASVTAAVIKEPDFLHGTEDEEPWAEGLLNQIRKVALAYKRPVEEVIKTGNPVAEITSISEFFNLIVIGSTTEEKEFLEPHIGELLVRKSACSALIITH